MIKNHERRKHAHNIRTCTITSSFYQSHVLTERAENLCQNLYSDIKITTNWYIVTSRVYQMHLSIVSYRNSFKQEKILHLTEFIINLFLKSLVSNVTPYLWSHITFQLIVRYVINHIYLSDQLIYFKIKPYISSEYELSSYEILHYNRLDNVQVNQLMSSVLQFPSCLITKPKTDFKPACPHNLFSASMLPFY